MDIEPGLYRAVDFDSCDWARLSGFSGHFDEIIADSTRFGASAIVELMAADKGFITDGCGVWAPLAESVTVSLTAPFGDGDYVVGLDIAAGTWWSSGGELCSWERLSGFAGDRNEIIEDDTPPGPAIVTIASTDAGFASGHCGEWTLVP